MPGVMLAERARATVLVAGRVQGVGYRAYARRLALDHGLAGYAENLADGRVEVVLEGERAEIEHLLERLKFGPAHASVARVEVVWSTVAEMVGFHVY
jgi:acylphosphatase